MLRARLGMLLASVLAGVASPAAAETYPVYKPLPNNPHDDHAVCHGKYWSWYSYCKQIREDEQAQYKKDAASGSQSPLFDENGTRYDGRRDAYSGTPTGQTSEWTYSGYATLARHKPLWGWYAPGTSAHPQWEQNGSQINSCDEYGYKRYYQVNRHLDAIGRLTAARRYDAAVDIILDGSPAVGDAKPLAPATGYYFVNYDGYAVTQFTPHFNGYLVQGLTPPDNRNPFWQVPTALITSLPRTGADWEQYIDWALAVSNSKSSPSDAKTWAYAKQMRNDPAITSLSAAERDEIASRVLRMRRALFRAAKQFEKCTNDRFRKLTASTAISPENLTFAEYVARVEPGAGYTDPIEWYELGLQAQLLNDASRSSTLSNVLAASSTTKDIYYYYSTTQTGKTLRSLASIDRPSLETAVSDTTTSYKGDPIAGCNAGYVEVARLLVEEYRRGGTGCMATNSKRCEFSPIVFARDVMDQLALKIPDIDLAKDQCLTYLGSGSFTTWYNYISPDSRKDLRSFETYFKEQKNKIDAALRNTPRRSELPDSIGDRRDGGSDWGDPSRFGAGYAYSAEWGVNVTNRTPGGAACRLGGQVKGSMSAYVTAFGVRRDLVSASLKARTAQPNAGESAPDFDAHVNVIGIDVYKSDDNAPLPASFSSSKTDNFDVPIVRTTILLGIVPVTIEAGVGFDYGYRLEAKFQQTDCTASTPPQLRLSGTATPHAGADAYVSAYVDLFVVGAGVKGELTLVEAHLPFDASIAVQPDSQTSGQYAVRAKSSLKLDLVELSGSIAFVVKVVGITVWEKVLFQWGGLRQTISLWNHDVEFPFAGFNVL